MAKDKAPKPRNLSQKSLKEVINTLPEATDIGGIMEALDAANVVYNGDMLKGTLALLVERGFLVQPKKGLYQKKPRTTGGTPSTMYLVDKPLEPQDAKVTQAPYDEKAFKGNPLYGTTPAQAVRKAKAHWYKTYYFPRLEAYRVMTEANAPVATPDKEEAAA